MNKVIDVENLRFGYGDEAVLSNLNFSIAAGDFAGIIGSNGSGKSTLLKLLLGLLSPSEGNILLFGEDIRHFKAWKRIGYVPQNSAAAAGNFPATAEEIVKANLYSEIGLMHRSKKEHRERARQALETVGMGEYAGRLIGNLSGGQQQRVMVARVLVNHPEVLMLDEPTNGVDTKTSDSLFVLLEALNRTGITILMVTHDVPRIRASAGRLFLMEEKTFTQIKNPQGNAHKNSKEGPHVDSNL